MNKLGVLSLCAATLLISGCQTSNLKGRAHSGYAKYSKEQEHKAFFVYQSLDGGFVYGYSHNRPTRKGAYFSAQRSCNQQFLKVNFHAECYPYDIDGIKVSSMSQAKITKLLNEEQQPPKPKLLTIGIYQKLKFGGLEFKGKMTPAKNGRSPLNIALDGTNCVGEGLYKGGHFTTDVLPYGIWSLTCENGRSAKGTYTLTAPNTGFAKGEDNLKEQIELIFKPMDS